MYDKDYFLYYLIPLQENLEKLALLDNKCYWQRHMLMNAHLVTMLRTLMVIAVDVLVFLLHPVEALDLDLQNQVRFQDQRVEAVFFLQLLRCIFRT